MAEEGHAHDTATPPIVYEVRIRGHLDPSWMSWLDGVAITPEENGDTLLTGPQLDQAALHALLTRVRDLGLPLVSVVRVPRRSGASERLG